jgi:hypothetical protein
MLTFESETKKPKNIVLVKFFDGDVRKRVDVSEFVVSERYLPE